MKLAPDPKDVQEFQFKQSTIYQLFEEITTVPAGCNLLVADKKRGLLYIGHENKITIYKPGNEKPEWKTELELPSVISKLSLSCDYTFLAVTPLKPVVLIYSVSALARNSLELLYEIRVSSANAEVYVADIKWNPSIPEMLCTVATDHTVGSFQVKSEKERVLTLKALERLNGLDVTCAAWSPKGKQIVVGCKNGNIVQLKPDLKAARIILGPTPYIGEVINILWISNYQFCAAYYGSEQGINVLIIDAPKGEATASFTCYEDITYGMYETDVEGNIPRYYFDHVPEWGLIIAGSSGSSEIAVLGSTDNGATWNQWQLIDSGRAQLPLVGTAESYPLGIAIDKSPVQKLPWGADSTLPHPVPLLHILGTSGQLCSFHMVNLTPNCACITSPPTEIVGPPNQPRPSIVPSELTFNLNNVATSTPRPKQVEPSERPKPAPTANIFGDFLKAAGLFQPTEQNQPVEQNLPKVQTEKPIITKTEIKPQVKEVVQQEIKLTVKTPVVETQVQECEEQKSTIDAEICMRAYLEEHNLFEKELRNRLEKQTWECGTEEERKQLGERAAVIDQFLRDLKETTSSLSSEIVCLKALLLQSFAWVEETKSKNACSTDMSQACGDTSKIAELQKLYYYTQSQLVHANKILDLEWSDHNSQKKTQMKIPSLEIIYQNLLLHNKIILREKAKLEQLMKRWKSLIRKHDIIGLNRSISNLNVSPRKPTSFRSSTSVIDARCKAIASKTLSFTPNKQAKLRNLLCESSPRIIKPVNPSPIQDRLEATLSSLASLGPASIDMENKSPIKDDKSTLNKQSAEKPKAQSPLASLNSFVARIGSSDVNNASMQNKTQVKSPSSNISFSSMMNKQPVQSEKKNVTVPAVPINTIQTKQKQDVKTYGQINGTANLPNLSKGFPSSTISFGTGAKTQEPSHQKSPPKEAGVKNEKESMDPSKNTSLFHSLNNVLTSEFSLPKGLEVTYASTPASATKNVKPETSTTFSFATPNVSVSTTKGFATSPASAMPTIKQQTFFFASKAMGSFSFNNKPTMFSGLSLGAQPSGIFNNNFSNDSKSGVTIEEIPVTSADGLNKLPQGTSIFAVPATTQTVLTAAGTATTTAASTAVPKTSNVSNSPAVQVSSNITSSTTSSIFGGLQTTTQSLSTSLFGGQSTATSMFGGLSITTSATTVSTVATTTSTFNISTSAAPAAPTVRVATVAPVAPVTSVVPVASVAPVAPTTSSTVFGTSVTSTSSSIFGGLSGSTSTAPSFSTTTSSTTSVFSMSKLTFGSDTATSTPVSTFTGVSSAPTTTVTFGSPTTSASAAQPFGKTTSPLVQNAQFAAATTTSTNVFGKPVISPASLPFGSSSNAPVFGGTTPSSTATIFSGTNSGTIFGGTATPSTTSASIFGGNTMSNFGTASTGSIFDSTSKTPNAGALVFGTGSPTHSLFGGGTNNAASPPIRETALGAGATAFGAAANNATTPPAAGTSSVFGTPGSPAIGGLGTAQPAFGQTASFGAKPVFGSPPSMFGATKPVFGGGFGTPTFGTGTASSGFGSPPQMGATPAPLGNEMPKVFGSATGGSNTFESLASQPGGLTFGSLAQKSPEPEKPVFTAGSSFSNWR